MTVTITEFRQTSILTWHAEWTTTESGPTFSIYRGGELIAQTKGTSWDFSIAAGDVPLIEILDDDSAPTAAFPGFFTLGWERVTDTSEYLIQEFVDPDWITRRRVIDNNQGFFTWRSSFLAAAVVHQFRILPRGTNNTLGLPVTFSGLMRRHPDPPKLAYAYDSGTQKVTVTDAS